MHGLNGLFLYCVLSLPACGCDLVEIAQNNFAGDSSLRLAKFIDSLPPYAPRDDIGASRFRITTKSPDTQLYFDQGLSLLHGYWEFEALRAFTRALHSDARAAMPYWGIYMAVQQIRRRAARFADPTPRQIQDQALQAALVLAGHASERERLLIAAAQAWDKKGRAAYIEKLQDYLTRFADQTEVELLLANVQMTGYDGNHRPLPGQLASESLLYDIVQSHPDHHGAHHYWIHTVEKSARVGRAESSARLIRNFAPGVPHIAHMPGHVYFRLGEYRTAGQIFEQARILDQNHLRTTGLSAAYHWNSVHNLFYLAVNLAEQGRYRDAMAGARRAQSLARRGLRQRDYATGTLLDQGLLAPAKIDMRFANWPQAVDTLSGLRLDKTLFGPIAMHYRDLLLGFSSGMVAAQQKDSVRLEKEIALLRDLRDQAQCLQDAMQVPNWLAPRFDNKIMQLTAQRQLLDQRKDAAIATLLIAAQSERLLARADPPRNLRPVLEDLGQVYLDLGDWRQALKTYQELLRTRPHSGFALSGLARAHDIGGAKESAIAAYRTFLSSWRYADSDLSQVQTARARLAKMRHKP